MAPTPPILFDPAPDLAAAVIAALTDPAFSFDQLAAAANTSSEALASWMQRPDIRERIESTDRATTWHTRLVANAHLHALSPALVKLLQDSTSSGSPPPNDAAGALIDSLDPGCDAKDFRRALLHARRAETARKAAALLFSLTRLRPTAGPDMPAAADHAPAASSPHPAQTPTDAEAEAPQSLGFESQRHQSIPNPSEQSPPNPQSEIPNPKSLDSLLVQSAPHPQVIAQELGIDHDHDENPSASSPEPNEPASGSPNRHRTPDRPTTHTHPPQRTGDRELAATSTREHWP